jgi:hypothetical protein
MFRPARPGPLRRSRTAGESACAVQAKQEFFPFLILFFKRFAKIIFRFEILQK